MSGVYYLHTNGDLIHKSFTEAVERDSDFVVDIWYDSEIGANPHVFLQFLLEAQKKGANTSALRRLFSHNNLSKFIPNAAQTLGWG